MVATLTGVLGPTVLQLVVMDTVQGTVLVPILPLVCMAMTALILEEKTKQQNATVERSAQTCEKTTRQKNVTTRVVKV